MRGGSCGRFRVRRDMPDIRRRLTRAQHFGILRTCMLGKSNVFLIGPMGSGKSAVGRQLARLLDLPFYDTDAEIERRTGVDIPFIFEKEGEAGFRQREREAIEALTTLDRVVLATGGGAVLLPENRRALAERGRVIYLKTSVAQQAERVRQGRTRPLLSNVDPTERLQELLAFRAPLYAEIADVTVVTDNRKVRSVADDILRELDAARPGG
jgi:shikimate kinase